MKESLRPIGDHIVVRRDPEQKMVGSIHIPDQATDKPTRGTVVAVGPGKYDGTGATLRTPMCVKSGDVVLFTTYAGSEVELDGEKFVVMREDDVLAIVETVK